MGLFSLRDAAVPQQEDCKSGALLTHVHACPPPPLPPQLIAVTSVRDFEAGRTAKYPPRPESSDLLKNRPRRKKEKGKKNKKQRQLEES